MSRARFGSAPAKLSYRNRASCGFSLISVIATAIESTRTIIGNRIRMSNSEILGVELGVAEAWLVGYAIEVEILGKGEGKLDGAGVEVELRVAVGVGIGVGAGKVVSVGVAVGLGLGFGELVGLGVWGG